MKTRPGVAVVRHQFIFTVELNKSTLSTKIDKDHLAKFRTG